MNPLVAARRTVVAVVLLVFVLSLSASAAARPTPRETAPKPRTLAVANDSIETFTQDSGAIAWVDSSRRVELQRISTGKRWLLGWSAGGGRRANQWPTLLALAGERAVWTEYWGGNSLEIVLKTSSPADLRVHGRRRATSVATLGTGDPWYCGGTERYFAGLAGDGATVFYAELELRPIPIMGGDACLQKVSGGTFAQVTRPSPNRPAVVRTIAGVSAPTALYSDKGNAWVVPRPLAVSRERIAVLPPADQTSTVGADPVQAENGPVKVFDANGTLVSQVFPLGTVREIALSWPKLAVLVQRHDGTMAVERYDARAGALELASAVPSRASDVAIGPGGLVYRVGNSIYVLGRRQPTLLWRAKGEPIGLSVVGRRAAWAVDFAPRGRIVALTLPR